VTRRVDPYMPVTPRSDPKRLITAADAVGDWDTSWGLVHPDALKYATKAGFIEDSQAAAARGQQLVSADIG
jgi:hypothetical protein